MMHGGGQWASFINFYSGGTVVLNTMRHFDRRRRAGASSARERCNSIMVVGDAMARPLAEALAAPGADYDIVVGSIVDRLGRRDPLARRSRSSCASAPERDRDRTASARRRRARAAPCTTRGTGRRAPVHHGRAHDGARRRPAPGRARLGRDRHGWRGGGHIPLGYFKDEEKTAATFLTDPDGMRWVVPGDFATHRGGRHHHPARPRLGLHQHRRREGLPRGGRGRAEGAPRRVRRRRGRRARRALRRAGRRHRQPRRRRRRRSRRCRSTAAPSSPATRCRASSRSRRRSCAHPSASPTTAGRAPAPSTPPATRR